MIYRKDNLILKPFIDFNEVFLKSNYTGWFDDPDIIEFTSHGIFPKPRKEFENFFETNGETHVTYMIIYSDIKKEMLTDKMDTTKMIYDHIGNISLQQIDWVNRSAELAIIIGEKDYHGKGIATIAVTFMLYHAFMKLGLNRVWSGTSEYNKGMQRVFDKCGFTPEGVFRQGKFLNGKFSDILAYGILSEEYKERDDEWWNYK